MSYGELIRLYFDRSSALQWYWTLYVVVIGGLLAFSSLRKQPDLLTALLVTVLYCFFAYKNLGAIGETSAQQQAVLDSIAQFHAAGADTAEVRQVRDRIEPTLSSTPWRDTRAFHVVSDVFTLAAVWAMEWRRWRYREKPKSPNP
jgi:hypothetical protein